MTTQVAPAILRRHRPQHLMHISHGRRPGLALVCAYLLFIAHEMIVVMETVKLAFHVATIIELLSEAASASRAVVKADPALSDHILVAARDAVDRLTA
jgi:hypothetical protein